MKKFLKLSAAFMLVGALFVGCIDNEEPDGVRAMREAKAKLLSAKADFVLSEMVINAAKAKKIEAEAALINKKADLVAQATEALKIKNDYERGILQAKIAAEIAALKAEEERQLVELWKARQDAAKQEAKYIEQLIKIQKQLAEAKIHALDQILKDIKKLILRRAEVENKMITLMAQLLFYENVERPYVERQLKHKVETAQLEYLYIKYKYEVLEEVKNLAVSEYVSYAEKLKPMMTDYYKQEVLLASKITGEEIILANLKSDAEKAYNAYLFDGVNTDLTNISIPNVFSTTVSDMFLATKVWVGKSVQADVIQKVLSGVYNNTYSFYFPIEKHSVYPEGSMAHLGYKNTLDLLKNDYQLIKDGRIYGVEGQYQVTQTLNARKKSMDDAIKAYETACKSWRDSYEKVKDGPSWGTHRTDFINAYNAYNNGLGEDTGLYGTAVYYLLGIKTTGEPTTDAYKAAKADAKKALDAVKKTDANEMLLDLMVLPVNCLYQVQKALIEIYIDTFKAMMKGEFADVDWLSKRVIISDILGGITFNPNALVSLILTNSNLKFLEGVVNAIMAVFLGVDIVDGINKIMPVYYAKTASFLGATIFGQGPLMLKYAVTGNWEYHLWFIIYTLFENNPVSIGNNIIRINSFPEVKPKLAEDFLGCSQVGFPGKYVYNVSTSTASDKAVVIGDRATLKNLTFYSGSAVPPGATSVLGLENALRTEWVAWGNALRALNKAEKDLYDPWHRIWTVKNHWGYANDHLAGSGTGVTPWPIPATITGTPNWISELVSGDNAVGKPAATPNKKAFYFMPELAGGENYPSLENGKHIYWANLADAWAFENFKAFVHHNPSVAQANYYPAIAVKRGQLTGVNWNEWLNEGYPTYINDPILWANDFSNTWENNLNLPTALVPKSFVTTRNYEQYLFWSSADTQQSYKDLADMLVPMIDALQQKVDELYQAWLDAEAAVTLKEYEIWALRTEQSLACSAYKALEGIYDSLCTGLDDWYYDEYNKVFHQYTDALKDFDAAKANLETFMTLGVYDAKVGSKYQKFIDDMRIEINAKIQTCQKELDLIASELKILEDAKENILNTVIPK